MEKVLISILGRGQRNKEGKFDYQKTKYRLENAVYETKLVSHALQQKFNFDKIYIVGTSESLWNIATEYLGNNYEKVIVPYGKSYEEFWEIFKRFFTAIKVENGEIYFDVTHGFRSIPIFVSTLLNFFTKVKGAQIKGVYYGIFEARDEEGITPIINMLPFLEMSRLIDAFYIFKKYSDGRDISEIIMENFKKLPSGEEKKKYGKLKSLANHLEFYSKSIGFSALKPYQKSLQKLKNIVNKIVDIPDNLKAIEFLIDDLKEEFEKFSPLTKEWEKDLETSKLLFERNRYAQSLTILRETLITYVIEEIGLKDKIEDEGVREKNLGALLKSDSSQLQEEKKTTYFTEEFLALNSKIRELRNKSNHAFIKKSIGDKDVKKSIENLEEFIREFKHLATTNKIIKDRQKVAEKLK